MLKQKQYAPLSVAQQAITLFAADRGYLKEVDVEKLGAFESALHSFFTADYSDLESRINETGDWDDDIEKQFVKVLESFLKTQTY